MTVDIVSLLTNGGPYGLAVGILILLIHGDLVPKWAHKDVCEERDYWRELALRGTSLAKDLVGIQKRD